MKQKYPYPLRLDETVEKKIKKLAKDNDRSFRGQIENILKKYIFEYENQHGNILIDDENKGVS